MTATAFFRLFSKGATKLRQQCGSHKHPWSIIMRNMCTVQPPKGKRLEGKTALVLGAAMGIGETTARLMAAHGARVFIADVEDASTVAAEIGNGAEYIACDVRNEDEVAAAMDRATMMGGLDVVHHNAGILGGVGPIDETHMDEFDYTLAVNLRGAMLGLKHAARVMKARERGGSIVVTGSVATAVGGLGPHAYTVAKHGMLGLVRSAAVELRQHNIRVNMVSPDGVLTNLFVQANSIYQGVEPNVESAMSTAMEFSPIPGRCLTTLDVANAVLFLASEESSFMTAQNLLVDAGNTILMRNDQARWYKQHFPLVGRAGNRGLP
eukprot:TRINITY_DN1267_c0_g3_i1.p1 TRINITY_DN1267_c0_g3~~TRINITY_DN1267_c0_g3_i1.p1  ORF type:complete len:323 (+),score=51.97 TRINITY_DN1267_c0_g3_i1:187-1155(+)